MADGTAQVLVARIGAPHGVRGEVRVKPFTVEPLALRSYGPLHDAAGRTYRVEAARVQKAMLVVRLSGVATREAAEALNGTELFVPRDALPPPDDDEFYAVDLIGVTAFEGGEAVGRVAAVEDFGAGDVLAIEGEGGTFWLDFTVANVPEVDLSQARIDIVRPAEVSERED